MYCFGSALWGGYVDGKFIMFIAGAADGWKLSGVYRRDPALHFAQHFISECLQCERRCKKNLLQTLQPH